jgi:hypothetical protein
MIPAAPVAACSFIMRGAGDVGVVIAAEPAAVLSAIITSSGATDVVRGARLSAFLQLVRREAPRRKTTTVLLRMARSDAPPTAWVCNLS